MPGRRFSALSLAAPHGVASDSGDKTVRVRLWRSAQPLGLDRAAPRGGGSRLSCSTFWRFGQLTFRLQAVLKGAAVFCAAREVEFVSATRDLVVIRLLAQATPRISPYRVSGLRWTHGYGIDCRGS